MPGKENDGTPVPNYIVTAALKDLVAQEHVALKVSHPVPHPPVRRRLTYDLGRRTSHVDHGMSTTFTYTHPTKF